MHFWPSYADIHHIWPHYRSILFTSWQQKRWLSSALWPVYASKRWPPYGTWCTLLHLEAYCCRFGRFMLPFSPGHIMHPISWPKNTLSNSLPYAIWCWACSVLNMSFDKSKPWSSHRNMICTIVSEAWSLFISISGHQLSSASVNERNPYRLRYLLASPSPLLFPMW